MLLAKKQEKLGEFRPEVIRAALVIESKRAEGIQNAETALVSAVDRFNADDRRHDVPRNAVAVLRLSESLVVFLEEFRSLLNPGLSDHPVLIDPPVAADRGFRRIRLPGLRCHQLLHAGGIRSLREDLFNKGLRKLSRRGGFLNVSLNLWHRGVRRILARLRFSQSRIRKLSADSRRQPRYGGCQKQCQQISAAQRHGFSD